MTQQATITNGTQNWLFEITGNQAEIFEVNQFGFIEKVRRMTTEEARTFYARAFRLIVDIRKGWEAPQSCTIETDQNPLYMGRPTPSSFSVEMGEVPLYVD